MSGYLFYTKRKIKQYFLLAISIILCSALITISRSFSVNAAYNSPTARLVNYALTDALTGENINSIQGVEGVETRVSVERVDTLNNSELRVRLVTALYDGARLIYVDFKTEKTLNSGEIADFINFVDLSGYPVDQTWRFKVFIWDSENFNPLVAALTFPRASPAPSLIDEFGENTASAGSWAKSFTHSAGMSLTSEAPAYHNGDVWKAQQGTAIPNAEIVYKLTDDITYFKVIKHKKTETSYTASPVKYYVSPDNIIYTEIPCDEISVKGITVLQQPEKSIPFGQKYLKIVIAGSPVNTNSGWNPRIGRVEIFSGDLPQKICLTHGDLRGLEAWRGVRPRVYADADKFEEISEYLNMGEPIYTGEYGRLLSAANAVAATPPNYIHRTDMLWQRDVGDNTALLAAAFKLSGNTAYLNKAVAWARGAIAYLTWGNSTNESDLEFGHLATGLSVLYDWCYSDMNEIDRLFIRDGLIRHVTIAYQLTQWDEGRGKSSPLGNHTWNTYTGLMTAGIALYDEYDAARYWVDCAQNVMERAVSLLGDDGATFEGYNYGTYAMFCMSRYLDMAKRQMNKDHFNSVDWFINNPDYYLYLNLPMENINHGDNAIDFADSWRGPSIGPAFFLWQYAGEQGNSVAQWLANSLVNKNYNKFSYLGLLWYDPSILPQSPSASDTLKHFEDQEIVISRSDWSGSESVVAYKCGPYMGNKVLDLNTTNPFQDWGSWHVHPDAGQFSVYGNGEWLIRDDGYAKKTSLNHNTLIINGQGQMGASNNPNNPNDLGFVSNTLQSLKARPKILSCESNSSFDYISSNAAPAYASTLGLTKFVRHLIYIKPNVLIVADDIQTNAPANLELRVFTEQQNIESLSNGSYATVGSKAKLHIIPLTNNGEQFIIDEQTVYQQAGLNIGSSINRKYIGVRKNNTANWVNVTAFAWSDKFDQPKTALLDISGSLYTITVDDTVIELDISQNTATFR